MKVENVFGNRYSGSVGKQLTAATWKGRNYVKRYFKPAQPRTSRQVAQRATFTAGVTKWQTFTATQKRAYSWMERYLKKAVSNFNMMLSSYINIIVGGAAYSDPEDGAVHVQDSVTTNDIEGAHVVIKKAGQSVQYGDGYTEADGDFDLGVAVEDQNYDVTVSAAGYTTQTQSDKTAAQVVALTVNLVEV